jgi:hypothetical protein
MQNYRNLLERTSTKVMNCELLRSHPPRLSRQTEKAMAEGILEKRKKSNDGKDL